MKIVVVNRGYFETIKGTELEKFHVQHFNIISINTPQYKPAAFEEQGAPFSECFFSCKNILMLKFHDYWERIPGVRLMTLADAKKIKKFMQTVDRQKLLIIHCTAGISRSRTVGLYLSLYYNVLKQGGDKQDYFDYLKKYRDGMRLNTHVKEMMCKVFGINEMSE